MADEKLGPTLSINEISIYAAADETERWNDKRCISDNLWQARGIRAGKTRTGFKNCIQLFTVYFRK